MTARKLASIAGLTAALWSASALAYDCSDLPEWKRQHYYLAGDQVQYEGTAYENTSDGSKRDRPDAGYPWASLGACETGGGGTGGGGTGGGGTGGGGGDPQPITVYGVWHCGNTFCDWSQPPDMDAFEEANRWIVAGNEGEPSVNLVVLSFVEPMDLLELSTLNDPLAGLPAGMTPDVVDYFKFDEDHEPRGIRVLLSMGGVTYTDAWNEALVTGAAELARKAAAAVAAIGADGLEIDWENGRPNVAELDGIETFIKTYNAETDAALTLDLAVGTRYLQELSRRAAADWLPDGDIDYVNAMVARGDPDTDQWQEHIDGKPNYDPPILPKAPAKVAVSLWLTDGRRPNPNCVDFEASSQLAKAGYVQTVEPNGEGTRPGLLGYMFWAAGCPSTRNVCTTPPNGCEDGMGRAAAHFDIQPLDFSALPGP